AHSVEKARAQAEAHGTLDSMVVDAALWAEDVRAAGFDAERVEARSRVQTGPELTLRDPRVDVTRSSGKIAASAGRVRASTAGVSVEGAVIEGLGDPIRAELSRDRVRTVVKLAAPRIDLARVTKLVGRDLGVTSGTLGLGADVTLSREDARGVVRATLEGFSMKQVTNARLDL